MDILDDPGDMTPEERLAEIVAILAAGYLRVRKASAHLAANKRLDGSPTESPPLDVGRAGREPATQGASG
jgi:hypothetical protein